MCHVLLLLLLSIPAAAEMELQQQEEVVAVVEIFVRISGRGDDDVDGNNSNNNNEPQQLPTITINDGHAVALSRTVLYSRLIPAGGFTFRDIFEMASRLQVRGMWLAAQLSREEFGGAAGQHAADLALIYNGATLDTIMIANNDTSALNAAMRRIIIGNVGGVVGVSQPEQQQEEEEHIPRLIICPYRSVPYEEICAICTETRAEKPRLSWAFAEGCEAHRFHSACIRGWHGGTCPICRARLI